jgi:hypothetical protein
MFYINFITSLLAFWYTQMFSLNVLNMYEVSFLYGLWLITYGIQITVFAGVRDFSGFVHRGELDILLLRPHDLLWQVMCGRLELISWCHISAGSLVLIWSSSLLPRPLVPQQERTGALDECARSLFSTRWSDVFSADSFFGFMEHDIIKGLEIDWVTLALAPLLGAARQEVGHRISRIGCLR